jgi:hypothetical protein
VTHARKTLELEDPLVVEHALFTVAWLNIERLGSMFGALKNPSDFFAT